MPFTRVQRTSLRRIPICQFRPHQITLQLSQIRKKITSERKTQEDPPFYHQPTPAFVHCSGLADHERLVIHPVCHWHSRENSLDDCCFWRVHRISLAAHLAGENCDVCNCAGAFEVAVPQRSKDPCRAAPVLPKGKSCLQSEFPQKAEGQRPNGTAKLPAVNLEGV